MSAPATEKVDKLSPRQMAFVQHYAVSLNATKACIEAGYSPDAAEQQGSVLMGNPKVAREIAAALEARAIRTGITQDWVVRELVRTYKRAAARVLVMRGRTAGKYSFQGAVAVRALELLGKHLGMFTDKIDLTSDGQSIAQSLEDTVARFAQAARAALQREQEQTPKALPEPREEP